MRKNLLLLCIVLLVAVVALVSCDEELIKNNKALGTWVFVDAGPSGTSTYTLIINSDSTCKMINETQDITTESTGIWLPVSLTEGALSLENKLSEYIMTGTYVVDGNYLELTPDDQGITFIFERVFK